MAKRKNRNSDKEPEILDDNAVDEEAVYPEPLEMLPIPAEEPEPEEKPKAETQQPEEPQANAIALRVWLTLVPEKWDQLAGFRSHAKRLALGPLTVNEWREEFNAFLNRPVN